MRHFSSGKVHLTFCLRLMEPDQWVTSAGGVIRVIKATAAAETTNVKIGGSYCSHSHPSLRNLGYNYEDKAAKTTKAKKVVRSCCSLKYPSFALLHSLHWHLCPFVDGQLGLLLGLSFDLNYSLLQPIRGLKFWAQLLCVDFTEWRP